MKYNTLKFLASEHKEGWAITAIRDGKKIMIGSSIPNEAEVDQLLNNIEVVKERYREKVDLEKEQLKKKVEELQKYKDIVDLIELSKITVAL